MDRISQCGGMRTGYFTTVSFARRPVAGVVCGRSGEDGEGGGSVSASEKIMPSPVSRAYTPSTADIGTRT